MSKIISIDDIQEGMINLEPIVNRYGQTLLAAGVVLTSQHSLILKTWNIRTIKISGGEEDIAEDLSDELKELVLSKLKKRAAWSPRMPIEEDLFAMTIKHLAKSIVNKSEQG